MILDYEIRDARKSIKEELRNLLKNCENISADSRAEYVRNMPQGSLVIPEMYIYTDGAKAEIEKATTKARESIKATLDNIYDKISEEVTAPPSQDAINTIQLLKMRSDISENEFMLYADKYKDNALANSMLQEIAHEKNLKVNIEDSKEMTMAKNLARYYDEIEKTINTYDAEHGKINAISIIGLESDLDYSLGVEGDSE